MRIRRTHQQQARQLWQLCLQDGRPQEDLLRAAIDDLMTRRPRGFLAVLHGLRQRMERAQRLTTARITTADPLTDGLRHDVEQAVRRRFPAATRIVYEDDPALLAGLRIQAGYDVIDDSLLGKLNRLHQKLQT
jgi:F0F1-type ATP synthase delta subunit